jgi:Alpha-L-rhamnosidase N-terminal domain
LAELRLTYADGFTETIATDESWESGPNAITSDDFYNGQSTNAGLVDPTAASRCEREAMLALWLHSVGKRVYVANANSDRLLAFT